MPPSDHIRKRGQHRDARGQPAGDPGSENPDAGATAVVYYLTISLPGPLELERLHGHGHGEKRMALAGDGHRTNWQGFSGESMRRKTYVMFAGLLPAGLMASVWTGVKAEAAASTATAAGTSVAPATVSIAMTGTAPQGPLPQGSERLWPRQQRPPESTVFISCMWKDAALQFRTWAKCRDRSRVEKFYWRYGKWARPTDVQGRYGTATSIAECNPAGEAIAWGATTSTLTRPPH